MSISVKQNILIQYEANLDGVSRWIMAFDPGTLVINSITYRTGVYKSLFVPVIAETVMGLLSSPQGAQATGTRPPRPNGLNLWKEAQQGGVLSHLELGQMEVLGIASVHTPRNLLTDFGAFPTVKNFMQHDPNFGWADAKFCYQDLLNQGKIITQDLAEELALAVDAGIYTQSQYEEFFPTQI